MSWQTYVDNNLLGTGRVTRAAILGLSGGVWAESAAFHLSREEQTAVVGAFARPNDVYGTGLRIAGDKYSAISADGRTIQLKKGPDGAVIVKTKQAVLVATYTSPIQAPETIPVVEALADYLISVGY